MLQAPPALCGMVYNHDMNITVLFDMDGVIVESEHLWDTMEPPYLKKILTPDIAERIVGNTRGCSVSVIYETAKKYGYNGNKEEFYSGYYPLGEQIYANAPLTEGMEPLIKKLHDNGAVIGLVSSSCKPWIMAVVNRMSISGSCFGFIESVDDHPNLRPKPAPDGYLAAMRELHADPARTIIIEDSQTGVNAALAANVHVCCFTAHVHESFAQGAHVYANTIKELEKVIYDFANSALK